MKSDYPVWRVVCYYALFGGAVGGAITGILIFPLIIFAVFYGAFLGFVPALLTGIYVAMMRMMKTAMGLLHAFLAGAVVSGAYNLIADKNADVMLILGLALVGGLSSLILACYTLPNPERLPENEPGENS